MRKAQLMIGIALLSSGSAMASDVQYNIRVDGITCPFCVATSSKELKKYSGVKGVSADLEKGIIKVCADETTTFTDDQLTKLFVEKGFSYRGMEKQNLCDPV
jgi:copper chaperone